MVNSSVSAAPPNVTYFYPAGAKQGTTVEVTPAGTLDANTKVRATQPGVSVEVEKGKFKVAVAPNAVPGVHWLRAYNDEGASALKSFIVGTLSEVSEKEPNDDFKKAQAIDGSCVVNGKLEKAGDVDCFAVQLKKGQTLVASLEANHTLRSPMDGMMQVLSADGFVLEENNDVHGLDPQIAFTAKKDGTYIVRVYAFPAQPDTSVRYFGSDACVYRLTLTTGAFADYPVPLAVPHLGPWTVAPEGWNIAPESKLSFVTGQPDYRFGTALSNDLPQSLRVRYEPHVTFGLKTVGTLIPPFSVTGRIEKPKGEETYLIEGKKGKPLTLEVESRAFGLACNPIVRVLDADKKLLARAEPGKLNGDTALSFTPPADGKYTVAITDLYAGGSTRHAFLLRVLSEPDYELTVAADRFTITPGKPTTIPVKVTRLRGFNEAIELSIDGSGSPPGVKVEVVQPAKPDPNTITLSLTADKPASGSFRLVGKVKSDPKLARPARLVVPDSDETTVDLWLTIVGKK